MAANHFTREELAQYILHSAEDEVIAKFNAVLEEENSEEIVAYTVEGKPLNIRQYKAEIQKGLDDIEAGRVVSHEDLLRDIQTW